MYFLRIALLKSYLMPLYIIFYSLHHLYTLFYKRSTPFLYPSTTFTAPFFHPGPSTPRQ